MKTYAWALTGILTAGCAAGASAAVKLESPAALSTPPDPAPAAASPTAAPAPVVPAESSGTASRSLDALGRFSLLGGVGFFVMNSGQPRRPAVALRYNRSWGSLEAGGLLPMDLSGKYPRASRIVGASAFDVSVQRVGEMHFTVHVALPHGNQRWFVPEIGYGVSALSILSRSQITFGDGTTMTNVHRDTVVRPVARVGLRCFEFSRVSLLIDAAYVTYPLHLTDLGETFDLSLTGWVIRPMVSLRL